MDALNSVHSDVSLVHALLRTLPVFFGGLLTHPPVHALISVHSDASLVHALLHTLPVLFVRLLTHS